jgi:hypothetical protein
VAQGRVSANFQRARSSLTWAGVFFLAVQLVGGLLLDHVWIDIRFPMRAQVLADLQSRQRPPDIVCLGSSRFMHGLPADEVTRSLREATGLPHPEVLNAGVQAGDTICYDYMMTQLERRGLRPAIVLIEVCPETVNHYTNWLGTDIIRQLGWQDVPRYFSDICACHLVLRLAKARLLPLFVHRRLIRWKTTVWLESMSPVQLRSETADRSELTLFSKQLHAEMDRVADNGKWQDGTVRMAFLPVLQTFDSAEDRQDATVQGVVQLRRCLKDYRPSGSTAASLERLIGRCRANGSEVILVTPPLSQLHRREYTPAIESAFSTYIRALAHRYRCRWVDFRQRVPDVLFIDNHHLLPEGGVHFSRMLAREVLAPEWERFSGSTSR